MCKPIVCVLTRKSVLPRLTDWLKSLHGRVFTFLQDLTDPCSGLPVLSERGGSYYPDVIGGQMLLNYDIIDTGCCKLLSHPKWHTKVYPATLFTTAPLEAVVPLLAKPFSLKQ